MNRTIYKGSFVGQVFGRLTVIADLGKIDGRIRVTCICECKTIKDYRIGNLKKGSTNSCGCLMKERVKEANTKHGLYTHKLSAVWHDMMDRCYGNPNKKQFKDYGGRGVIVCDEWKHSLNSFYDWAIKNGWEKGLQLDKDKLSPYQVGIIYSPEYCCFITPKENAKYKTTSRMIEYKGQIRSLPEWAEILGLNFTLLSSRYKQGWDAKSMFETPLLKRRLIEYNNEFKLVSEWSYIFRLKPITVSNRLGKGWDIKKALETPCIEIGKIKNKLSTIKT